MAPTDKECRVSLEAELKLVEGVADAQVNLEADGPIGLKIAVVPGSEEKRTWLEH